MARARAPGNGRMEELIATVLQGQALMQQNTAAMQQNMTAMQQNMTAMQGEWRELLKLHYELRRESAERFARIEQRLTHIEAILLEHNRMLTGLPDAVRDKIGFKPGQGPA